MEGKKKKKKKKTQIKQFRYECRFLIFEEDLIPVQLCVVFGYSAGWQEGLTNMRDDDLIICCTKSSSITQAGSELDFL